MTSSNYTAAFFFLCVLLALLLAGLELMCLKKSIHVLELWPWGLLLSIINFFSIFILITILNSYFFLLIFPVPLFPIVYSLLKLGIYYKLVRQIDVAAPSLFLITFLSIIYQWASIYFIYEWFKDINPTMTNLATVIREKRNDQLRAMLWMSIKQESALTILVNEGIMNGNLDAVNILIQKGANPREEYWLRNASNPLRWLIIKWMLDKGVKPAEINTSQSPRIEEIAVSYSTKELEFCIEKGLNPKDYPGIIHAALDHQDLKDSRKIDAEETQSLINKIKILLNNGADINGNDHFFFKPIFSALLDLDMSPVLKFMLENGADVNAKTKNKINPGYPNELPEGITPLMLAAHLNNLTYIQLLLNHGADKRIKDSLGHTAFDYAVMSKVTEEVKKKLH